MKKLLLTLLAVVTLSAVGMSQKYAFVDSEYILENISEYQMNQDKLDELAIDWQKEIEKKFNQVDKMYKDFQAEAALLPDAEKVKRQNAIIKAEKDAKKLQNQRFGKEGDLFKKRQELIKPIQDRIYNAIEEYASANNYAIIFDKSGSLTMLYANSKFDKSDDILDKMGYRPGGTRTDDK